MASGRWSSSPKRDAKSFTPSGPRACCCRRSRHRSQHPAPRASALASPDPGGEFDENAQALFEALRHHRLALARDEKVPPYVIASDRTLRDIVLLRPANLEELKLAHGIGPAKAEKYGDGLLGIVQQAT